jgi:hypothetical protein
MIILCACGINILLGIRNIKRHTMLCPAHEICIISSYDEMDAWEARLRLAILALVPDSRGQGILADAILDAIRNIPGIDGRDMSVRKFFPKRFLIIFIMLADRDYAIRTGWVNIGTTRSLLRPWMCLVSAEADELHFYVAVEFEGIPAHAASPRTSRMILSSSCWMESDQSVLKITAWTDNPSRIPRTITLLIAEHEQRVTYDDLTMQIVFRNLPPYLRCKDILSYPIIVHLWSTADFRSRTPSTTRPSAPSSDGDSGYDGNQTTLSHAAMMGPCSRVFAATTALWMVLPPASFGRCSI